MRNLIQQPQSSSKSVEWKQRGSRLDTKVYCPRYRDRYFTLFDGIRGCIQPLRSGNREVYTHTSINSLIDIYLSADIGKSWSKMLSSGIPKSIPICFLMMCARWVRCFEKAACFWGVWSSYMIKITCISVRTDRLIGGTRSCKYLNIGTSCTTAHTAQCILGVST